MTRDELVKLRQAAWKELESLTVTAEQTRGARALGPSGVAELAERYRSLAADLMRVRRDKLGADLERYLDNLASRAHNALYGGTYVGSRFELRSILLDFPGALRRNLRFFLLASVLFYLPGIVAGVASYADEQYALAVLSQAQLDGIQEMHSKGHAEGRAADQSAVMTGFYVYNNIGIAFRCFVTGILFGIGPLFFLIYNGLTIGVTLGHLVRSGYGENILSFVSTHGPWELTAIVISGAAGLQIGYALVVTRGRTRLGNLRAHGLEVLRQIAGATAFLALAALLEAWYSPSALPPMVKYVSGGVSWVLVLGILALAGRRRAVPDDAVALAPRERG